MKRGLENRIAELQSAGIKSAAKISRILRDEGFSGATSASSIKRRRTTGRGPNLKTDPALDPAAAPAVDVAAMADVWIKRLEKASQSAETAEQFAHFARTTSALLEIRRKAEPPPKIDLNQDPEMLADAAFGKERLLRAIETAAQAFAADPINPPDGESKAVLLAWQTMRAIQQKISGAPANNVFGNPNDPEKSAFERAIATRLA